MPTKKDHQTKKARETLKRALANLQDAAKEATDRDGESVAAAIAEVNAAIAGLPDAATVKTHCNAALNLAVVQDTYPVDKAIVGLSVQQARFEITNALTFQLRR
jgi:hypothetical protein